LGIYIYHVAIKGNYHGFSSKFASSIDNISSQVAGQRREGLGTVSERRTSVARKNDR
jgi:hypothetical protein